MPRPVDGYDNSGLMHFEADDPERQEPVHLLALNVRPSTFRPGSDRTIVWLGGRALPVRSVDVGQETEEWGSGTHIGIGSSFPGPTTTTITLELAAPLQRINQHEFILGVSHDEQRDIDHTPEVMEKAAWALARRYNRHQWWMMVETEGEIGARLAHERRLPSEIAGLVETRRNIYNSYLKVVKDVLGVLPEVLAPRD